MILLNIIVLAFEVLYYSLFMKFARKEGKMYRYILLFILFSIITLFLNKRFIINYIFIFLIILYGIKYIVRIKTTLYDLLIIIIMFIGKVIIEIPTSMIMYNLFKNIYLSAILVSIVKILLLIIINNKFNLNSIYKKLHKIWNENNFYIRYIFCIFMFTYVIVSCIFLIINWI